MPSRIVCTGVEQASMETWLSYRMGMNGQETIRLSVKSGRVLLINQRMKAEKSQAVMKKGQKTHKNTPPPEPALKAGYLLTSKYEYSVVSH